MAFILSDLDCSFYYSCLFAFVISCFYYELTDLFFYRFFLIDIKFKQYIILDCIQETIFPVIWELFNLTVMERGSDS